MSGALHKNAISAATRTLRRNTSDLADPIGRLHPVLRDLGQSQRPTQFRAFLRLPHFLGKAKEYGISPPFSSAFWSSSSSSSSASTASVSSIGFVAWYLSMVKSWPVFTKSVTSSLIYTAADLSSQTIAQTSSESYDLVRTARMAGYGLLIVGPTLHYWFNLMSRLFPKRDLIPTFKKMVMGQTIYGPTMTVVFFSLNAGLQGESTSEIIARLKRDLLPTMLNGVMYWPICDFITFKFFPVHLQLLASNSFAYLWTMYMTYMASSKKASASPSLPI